MTAEGAAKMTRMRKAGGDLREGQAKPKPSLAQGARKIRDY